MVKEKRFVTAIPLTYSPELDAYDYIIFGLSNLTSDEIKEAYNKAQSLTNCEFHSFVCGGGYYGNGLTDEEELLEENYSYGISLTSIQKLTPFIIVEEHLKKGTKKDSNNGYPQLCKEEYTKLLIAFIKVGNPNFLFEEVTLQIALSGMLDDFSL